MSRSTKRRKSMQKNRFKTTLIALAIVVCLFVIYKYNFTTKSEITITTSVKFKEFEGENELYDNVEILEDDNGKYIILPEKVNGIYTSAYYLPSKKDVENETILQDSNTTIEDTTNSNTISSNSNVTNSSIDNMTVEQTVTEEIVVNKIVENKVVENTTVQESSQDTTSQIETESEENVQTENKTEIQAQTEEQTVEEQLSALSETTLDSEEYADKLEEIAGVSSQEETNEAEVSSKETSQEENSEANITSQTVEASAETVQTVENVTDSEDFDITLPGDKYYLSDEEVESDNLELTVKFQTVEVKGEVLYNQNLTVDMEDAIIELTCYIPFGYYLKVEEEDLNTIQELKADVESLADSQTVLAYDITITNGEEEYQPEDYYQVATVSITKPVENIDYSSNSQSLQLLHIKEDEQTINFQKMQMSKLENDSFEFLTDEFSVYAVILYDADQGTSVTINDYTSDKNYYLGKNYTDFMAGYDTEKYSDDNLIQVNINYYSYDPDANSQEDFTLSNCNWSFDSTNNQDISSDTVVGSRYTIYTKIEETDEYVDTTSNWSMEFVVPSDLRDTFSDFNITKTTSANSGLTFMYSSTTYTLTVSAQDMSMWDSTSEKNSAIGPYELYFVLYFDGDVTISSFTPTSQKFSSKTRVLVGTTSVAEEHVLYSYVKCLPIRESNGNKVVNIELIDNPFMNRPAGFGFNGWLTKDTSSTIVTNSDTYLQTIQKQLTTTEISSKNVTIDVYVDWEEASVVFVNTNSGSNSNSGLTESEAVSSWSGVTSRLKKISTETASDRELNIIVLTEGSLDINNIGSAYTITSLYNGTDNRANTQLNITSSFVANYDLQIDYIYINSNQSYEAIEGYVTVEGYLSGGSNNLRIARGVASKNGNSYATISQVFGAENGISQNYRMVIESGYYNNIQVLGPGDSDITTSSTLVLGSDLDRINNNNADLAVYYRVASTGFGANVYTTNVNKFATNIIVKSGRLGCDGFSSYYSSGNTDYAYAGIYVGGHGSSLGSFYGNRGVIVEGGEVANIIGGLKIQTYLSSQTYIYVKGGTVGNIVGGAGLSKTYGDRIIQVTGGTVEYSVSGGSNGFVASGSDNGELIGNTLVYVGGNAIIGSEDAEYDSLYGIDPGTVCGAGNGKAGESSSGKVYTSHVIIDGNATINNNVYGGGNYGYVQKDSQTATDISSQISSSIAKTVVEDCSNNLVSGEKYVIAEGTSIGSKAIYNNGGIGIGTINGVPEDSYSWTLEGTSSSFKLKNGNYYLVMTASGSPTISYTSDSSQATTFSYTTSNHRISYTNGRSTFYWRDRDNTLSTVSGTMSSYATSFYFLKITKEEKQETSSIIDESEQETAPEKKTFEVDCIDIVGGTIKNNVYGGSNKNKITGNVDINVTGGTVNGAIYGGSNESGNVSGNVTIDVEGGTIGTQKANDAIFGGGYGSSTTINGNVNISINDKSNNVTILGNTFGGSSLGNISGNINIDVEDHYSDSNEITIQGNILGGGKGSSSVTPQNKKDVNVTVDGGDYQNAIVFGGCYTSGQILGNILLKIGENYETTIDEVYGGGNLADIDSQTDSVYVYLYKNATVTNAYNGGMNAGISGNNDDHPRSIYAIGATVKEGLYGGCNVDGSMSSTYLYCQEGAKVANVYGGGYGSKAKVTSDGTHVYITNSTITENVYGGGDSASVNADTEVEILGSTVNGKVFGGGNKAEVKGNTNVYIGTYTENGTTIESDINEIYGGGNEASVCTNSDKSANVTIVASKVTNVYGGGLQGKTSGNTFVTIQEKSTIRNNVYGGGLEGIVAKATGVTIIEESTVENNVYGGGSQGDVSGNAKVTINNATVKIAVFGGGEIASVYGTEVSITDSAEVANVYGGGDNGIVTTNTSVALKDAKITENAFGAGNGESAVVEGKSYIYASGTTTIGKSIFAGGNNAATGTSDTNPNKNLSTKAVEKATAVVDIAGATIGENVYGGANTSVIYGDVTINLGNEAISTYYTSIGETVPSYTIGKIYVTGTIYGGGEQMDPNKEYNYNTVSVEGYININIDGTGYDSSENTIDIKGSIFGSGHASRAGLLTSYLSSTETTDEQIGEYTTINGDVSIKNYGSVDDPKPMISIQRCSNVVIDSSSLWISGATDSTNTHSSTYFSFNHIDALKLKNSSTLYLRATSNLLKSFYSLVDVDGTEEKATVDIINEITGADGNTYDAKGSYVYNSSNEIEYVVKSGQIFTADSSGNAQDLVTNVESSRTKSVTKNTDNRVYMYSGLNLNISTDENLGDDSWGPVEGMTFFGIFNTTNTTVDTSEDTDISQTTDTNSDTATIHTGMYSVNYQVSDTTQLNWSDRNFNRCYVEGQHVKDQNIQEDGFYTNYEKFAIEYDEDAEIEEDTYASHNPTSYTDYITPTPEDTNYYIWYAGPDQDFYYYNLALVASKLSTYGTIEKTLQGINVANATFKITGVESSLINNAQLYEKSEIDDINLDGDPNKEFALSMKTGGSGWSMNGETEFTTSPTVDYTGTSIYKTENSSTTPTLGFYLYHSNNISEEAELGYFTINMSLYYWKTATQQARAKVTIDVAISTKVYDDLGYDASITPGRQYELFPRTTTNITTKSSFSAYFQLYEKNFAENSTIQSFFSTETTDATTGETVKVVDTDAINNFMANNYRYIKTDYVFPEDTTITMIDNSTKNPTYYYYVVTANDVANNKKTFYLTDFKKMGSTSKTSSDVTEYYLATNRDNYVTTVDGVTYQSESFIFIVDLESAKFQNIDSLYEIVKNQEFKLILTSDQTNSEGSKLEISILDEYQTSKSISFGIYNTSSVIGLDATISPNKIYLGDSAEIDLETNYGVVNTSSDITTVYDTRYFDSKLGVKITIYDEDGNVVKGANLLGAYFEVTEADGTQVSYYPRTDGTTRMKIADKVSNSKATITFETAKSTLPTGTYTFLIESFGSADGVYFGTESSDSIELTLNIVNDEFGLSSTIPATYMIIDKDTGYGLTDDTDGFTLEEEYEITDENGNVIGETSAELNAGKNTLSYDVTYSSGYENPIITMALYRRDYDSIYGKTYSLVDLADYLNYDDELTLVPDDIKDQFLNSENECVGYIAYDTDFINDAVSEAQTDTSSTTRPTVSLKTVTSVKSKLVSGTYKLVFTLYDKSEVEKVVETEKSDGTITAEKQTVVEYQNIGQTYSYIIIK